MFQLHPQNHNDQHPNDIIIHPKSKKAKTFLKSSYTNLMVLSYYDFAVDVSTQYMNIQSESGVRRRLGVQPPPSWNFFTTCRSMKILTYYDY